MSGTHQHSWILKNIAFGLMVIGLAACDSTPKETRAEEAVTYPDIHIAGAMRNVMWKGELGGIIQLDTISDKAGLYGIGPVSYLRGELLINNGKSYVSKVTSDSTMTVQETYAVSAPFFVYAHVTEWTEVEIPANVKSIPELETLIDSLTQDDKRPFAFKLIGSVTSAVIHIQNLPEGTQVSSPKEAHQGQVKYPLGAEEVEIIGFFSTEHQGVFTHHDSFLHMHLITQDERQMGHLDALEIDKMALFLPRG